MKRAMWVQSNVHQQHLKWLSLIFQYCSAVEITEVSGLHWRMYCGMYNMWHKGMDWLYNKFCQSYVHRKAGQQSLCQQQVVTLTWWGSWWSSTEQTCITRQRRVVHLLSVIHSVIHISHVYLYSLWFTSYHWNTHIMYGKLYSQSDGEIPLPSYISLLSFVNEWQPL